MRAALARRPAGRIRPCRVIRSSIEKAPARQPLQDRLELVRLDLRQEADLAEVDAEQGHVDLGDGPRRPQERAVAAEDDQGASSRAARGRAPRAPRRRRPRRSMSRARRTRPRPARGARPRPRSSGCRRSRAAGSSSSEGHGAGRHAAARSSRVGARRPTGPAGPGTPRCSEELAVALPGPGAARRSRRRLRGRARGPSRTTRSRTAGGRPGRGRRRRARAPRPASNCGLTRATIRPPGAEAARRPGPEHERRAR